MSSLFVGILMLLGLVGIQLGFRYLSVYRTKKAWAQAQADLERGDLASAERGIARCVKLMPLWLHPRFLLGAILARQGKLKEAEEQLKLAQALQPREPEGFIELGIFYVTEADRVPEGIEAFRDALACGDGVWETIENEPRLVSFRATEAYATLAAEAHAG